MVACRRDYFSAPLARGTGTRIGGLRHQRLLPQPPGRYSAFEDRDRPQIQPDKRTITQVHFRNLIL